nr:HPr family phosphocarrier protein [uncultured Sellimonas sp.]
MREVYVNIGSVEKAKGLNGVLRKLEGDFDLVQGRATIDAKSFLGILSMDLSKSVKLIIHDSASIDMTLLEEYIA